VRRDDRWIIGFSGYLANIDNTFVDEDELRNHSLKALFGSTEKEGRGGEVRRGIFKEGRRGKT
jgi:hypothetical protein